MPLRVLVAFQSFKKHRVGLRAHFPTEIRTGVRIRVIHRSPANFIPVVVYGALLVIKQVFRRANKQDYKGKGFRSMTVPRFLKIIVFVIIPAKHPLMFTVTASKTKGRTDIKLSALQVDDCVNAGR